MNATIDYGSGAPLVNAVASVPATLTVTETDLFKTVTLSDLKFSQFTVYVSTQLTGATKATFNYYYSPDQGTTWYPVSLYNTSTGEIVQRSVVVDTGTYSTSGHYRFVDNTPAGSMTAFKITGKVDAGTPTLDAIIVAGRNN